MSNHREWLRKFSRTVWLLPLVALLVALFPVSAKADDSGFNIQVTPSPLVVTLNPGQSQTATLTVRNLSNHPETLVPHLTGFTIDPKSEKISLNNQAPEGLGDWVSFKQSTLTIAAGASVPLEVIYNTPENVGFSYALAITLNPTDKQKVPGGANIQAAVAVFNLINVNRPGAKRQLEISSFKGDHGHYEFLPAKFKLTLKNTGNVIDQPTGSIYIQHSFDDEKPITTIPINKAGSYVLPDTSRTYDASWEAGFPHHVTTNKDGKQQTDLSWEWKNLNQLRFGKYVAKVVLVYNDGQRDVPLVASYSFWVIPWRLIFGALFFGGLIVTGVIAWGKMLVKGTNRVRKYAKHK